MLSEEPEKYDSNQNTGLVCNQPGFGSWHPIWSPEQDQEYFLTGTVSQTPVTA